MASISNAVFRFPIEKILSEQEYRSRYKGEKKIVSIFLIALGKPEEVIFKYLEDADYHENKYGLTPLTVATMMGNHRVMKRLLNEKNVNPQPKDFAALTPAHYASARKDQKALTILKMKVNDVSLNAFENFPGWKTYLETRLPKADDHVIDCKENGQTVALTASEFHQRTGAQFYEGVRATPDAFMDMLIHRLKQQPFIFPTDRDFNNFLLRKYSRFQQNPPQFCMVKQGEAGYGLIAKCLLKAGEICAEYNGRLFFAEGDLSHEIGEYYFPGRDASKIHGVAALMNDSFPNATFLPIYFLDGRCSHVLIPMRNIEPGEGIFIDYQADHRIKHLKHAELNFHEMKFFFENNNIDLLLKLLNSNMDLSDENPEVYSRKILMINSLGSRLIYPFNTPTSLIYLYLKRILSWSDIQKLHFHPFVQQAFQGNSTKQSLLDPTMRLLQKLEEFFSRHQRITIDQYLPWLLELTQSYSFKGILEAFSNHFSLDVTKWKKKSFECVAQATEKYETIVSKSTSKEQKNAAFEEYCEIIQALPIETRVEMSMTLLTLCQKYPEFWSIMTEVTERFKSKHMS